jgi:uncharacterized protein YceH (UPF0502 family)
MTDDEVKRLLDAMQQQNAAAQAETRRHFDEAAERLAGENKRYFDISTEAFKHEVRFLAEAVAHLDQRMARAVEGLDEKIDGGFADTQAMIKFSHAELERRVRLLEQAFADLHSRVERLEGTTH